MRYFYRYLLITLSSFFLLGWMLPQWLPIHYPRALGPVFSAAVRTSYQEQIESEKPEVILLGNSVLKFGIDQPQFEQLIGRKTQKLGFPGSASAYWYLIIKNNIVTASTPPQYLIIFFLDNMLTTPDLGVNGTYIPLIDEIAGENETQLLQKAYLNQLNPIEGFLDSHFPVFGERQSIKEKINGSIEYTLPQLFMDCNKVCLDNALDKIFNANNMLPYVLPQSELNPEDWSGSEWEFNALVEKSFIPDMIQITKEAGIQLILVREKNANVMTSLDESTAMHKYFQDMAVYLKEERVPLLDFSHDPALTLDLFLDEQHLNPQGMVVFTRLVAESFLSLQK
jgi:hypothetical protein